MDIRDELSMISSVFSEQERVIQTVKKLVSPEDDNTDAIRDQLEGAELGISLWKKRLSNIDQRAQVVEKALGHLLSLKLEVSNLALQVKADKQSGILFAFTVVTVLYS
ncbi:hypothetical protein N0V84_004247 [Fusarium piperis]|uniref:Uncharacterized protein n=1 Tax=Fusarium piperis TaxID=1435070 RepID=A0A9W9BQF0_9HYPO|nr:hypothetical protein N0V84_004247 [Fusarium piperis]